MTKKAYMYILIAAYLLVLNLAPFVIGRTSYSTAYNFDYYSQSIGAAYINEEGYIPFEKDPRKYWAGNEDTSMSYPPGFMMLISQLSQMLGLSLFTIPVIIRTVNYAMFLILLAMLARLFIKKPAQLALVIFCATFFISGTHALGFAFAVPAITGYFLIWGVLFLFFREGITPVKTVIAQSILLTMLFLVHRPTTITFFFVLASLSAASLFFRIRPSVPRLGMIFLSTIISAALATAIYLRMLLSSDQIGFFRYSYQIPKFFQAYPMLGLIGLSCCFACAAIICWKRDVQTGNCQHNSTSQNTALILSAATLCLFTPAVAIIAINFLKMKLSLAANPTQLVLDIWEVVSLPQFLTVRQVLYVFHLGLLPVITYFAGLYIIRKNRMHLLMGLISISLTGISFILAYGLFDKFPLPHRIFLYIMPSLYITSSYALIMMLNDRRLLVRYMTISLLVLNIIFAANINAVKSQAWPDNQDHEVLLWIGRNLEPQSVVLAQDFYTQPGLAFGAENMQAIRKYNPHIVKYLTSSGASDILFLTSVADQQSIIDLDRQTKTDPDRFERLFDNGEEIIYRELQW